MSHWFILSFRDDRIWNSNNWNKPQFSYNYCLTVSDYGNKLYFLTARRGCQSSVQCFVVQGRLALLWNISLLSSGSKIKPSEEGLSFCTVSAGFLLVLLLYREYWRNMFSETSGFLRITRHYKQQSCEACSHHSDFIKSKSSIRLHQTVHLFKFVRRNNFENYILCLLFPRPSL
jgi:hypothetical protein